MTAVTATPARTRTNDRTLTQLTRVLLGVMVGLDVLFVIGLVVLGDLHNPIVTVGLTLATQAVPVAIFWLVAAHTGLANLPVMLAATAVTFSALGDLYYALAMDADGNLAFPSPADPAYLLFYPLMVAALALLARRQMRVGGRLVLLETAVATLGASAVLAVILEPVIAEALSSDNVLSSVTAIAYPLFDLLLLAVIAGITSVSAMQLGRRWWALVTGLGIFVAADIAYAIMTSQGTYLAGTPLDAAWAIGLAFITWWVAGVPSSASAPIPELRPGLIVPLPAVALLAGLAVLVVGTVRELSTAAIALAAVTVGLGAVPIIFRQAMMGRMLAARDDAVRRLTELDQQKTDILVTVNHEFRTPLTSINGHVELLLDGSAGELPKSAIGMLETIERNGARLQGLIDATMTASALESGLGCDVVAPIEAAGILTRAVARVQPLAARRGVELALHNDDPTLVIDAVGARLEDALVNIIDNAVKFTDAGGRATVHLEGTRADGEVVIRISDTGVGVPADDIPRLFTRFFRASNVQKAAIPGVGLGLSISQQIVQAHGGSIEVQSAEGPGTIVTVRLPGAATKKSRRPRRTV
jgi:signal transduction histidine kinase